jgi:uncharacterized membrane protein YjfL (UPF0719 family)
MSENPLYLFGFEVLAALVGLLIFQLGQRVLSPDESLRTTIEKGNVARAILQAGHVLAVFMVASSVVVGGVQGVHLATDALWVGAFGLCALALLEITGRLGVKLLLRSKLLGEIERGNVAAGIAAAGHYVATGIIIARNLNGTDLHALAISLVFFAIAQITLHLFVVLFRALTTYDDSEEILGENLAAALSYAGVTVAIALIVGHASEGQFVSWSVSLTGYAMALAFNFALYPVRQIVVQTLLLGCRPTLRAGRLDEGVGRERNVGMAALEAVAYLATALAVNRLG